ncbi:MAG TPA: DUF2846 domain-containing protein [Lacunisphaera sp.]|jgi:hypothetical protein|nr:DUF2846 domain-containing protein [Lacunisphaera sp.]
MKMIPRLLIVPAIAGFVLFFSGCASVPMATTDKDAKSKEFQPLPDRASLYIYRNENFGAAIPMTVSVNKRTLGQTAAKTYFHVTVPPGRYTVESITENVSSVNLSLDAGKNYFVWQEVKMGMWSARSALQLVDDAKGRAGVLQSKQIASTIPDSEFNAPGTSAPVAPVPPSATKSFAEQLQELDTMKANKTITEDEYQKMRAGLVEKYQK